MGNNDPNWRVVHHFWGVEINHQPDYY
jgi:hypothetical protein